jgi:hypothetical protein
VAKWILDLNHFWLSRRVRLFQLPRVFHLGPVSICLDLTGRIAELMKSASAWADALLFGGVRLRLRLRLGERAG